MPRRSGSRWLRAPSHLLVEALAAARRHEAEVLVEGCGRVRGLHVEDDRYPGGRRLLLELPQQRRAHAPAAVLGQERDVEQMDAIGRAVDVEASRRLAVELDDREG